MVLRAKDHVHIAPMGYERDRVVRPAMELKADKVVIVGHKEDEEGSSGMEYREAVKSQLEEQGIEFDVEEADLFEMYDAMGAFIDIIHESKESEIYLNVATGTKITAIAGMLACMFTENATPYYPIADSDSYDDDFPTGPFEYVELPEYPIDPPEKEQIQVLNYIQKRNDEGTSPSKKRIINFCEEQEFDFIVDSSAKGKAKYQLVDAHVLDPLRDRGHVRIRKDGRSKQFQTTREGEQAVNAFGYLLDGDRSLQKI